MPTEIELPEPGGQVDPPIQQDPVAPPVAEPEQVVDETVPYRSGEFEAQLPLSALQAIAESLGFDNPAAVVNQLRNGAEAQDIYRQARTIYQQARQRAQAPQYAPQPQNQVEQRWQQHVQRQQPQSQPGDPDPIELLSGLVQDVREMRAQQVQREQAEQQRNFTQLDREANREYQKFSSELKKQGVPDWKIPDRDYLLGEAEMMGMFHSDTPVGDMYRNIYKMMNSDSIAQSAASNAVQSHVERLRDPRARVSVPVARPAPAPRVNPATELDSMKIGDILPEGRY